MKSKNTITLALFAMSCAFGGREYTCLDAQGQYYSMTSDADLSGGPCYLRKPGCAASELAEVTLERVGRLEDEVYAITQSKPELPELKVKTLARDEITHHKVQLMDDSGELVVFTVHNSLASRMDFTGLDKYKKLPIKDALASVLDVFKSATDNLEGSTGRMDLMENAECKLYFCNRRSQPYQNITMGMGYKLPWRSWIAMMNYVEGLGIALNKDDPNLGSRHRNCEAQFSTSQQLQVLDPEGLAKTIQEMVYLGSQKKDPSTCTLTEISAPAGSEVPRPISSAASSSSDAAVLSTDDSTKLTREDALKLVEKLTGDNKALKLINEEQAAEIASLRNQLEGIKALLSGTAQ